MLASACNMTPSRGGVEWAESGHAGRAGWAAAADVEGRGGVAYPIICQLRLHLEVRVSKSKVRMGQPEGVCTELLAYGTDDIRPGCPDSDRLPDR
jgi:hypothetical protein